MRDFVAGIVALALIFVALSLMTTLTAVRRWRARARDSERERGRTIIAEVPGDNDLVLVSEDEKRLYYGDRSVDKDFIVAVRVLINGSPIVEYVTRRHAQEAGRPTSFEDRPEGIARDRWDVAVESTFGTTII